MNTSLALNLSSSRTTSSVSIIQCLDSKFVYGKTTFMGLGLSATWSNKMNGKERRKRGPRDRGRNVK